MNGGNDKRQTVCSNQPQAHLEQSKPACIKSRTALEVDLAPVVMAEPKNNRRCMAKFRARQRLPGVRWPLWPDHEPRAVLRGPTCRHAAVGGPRRGAGWRCVRTPGAAPSSLAPSTISVAQLSSREV
jgi:hypothetical protein